MHALIAAAMMFVASFATAAAAPPELQKMQDQMLGVTAQLNENCSATLIHSKRDDVSGKVSTLFLTAKHCVESGSERDMTIDLPVYQDGRVVKKDRYIVRVRAQDYKSDLALVKLKDDQTFFKNPARIGEAGAELYMAQQVWTVGYPLGQSLTISTGLFGLRETLDWPKPATEYFRATPDATFGNSGGAMYTMQDGDYVLIGTVTGRRRDNTFMTLYTPVDTIRAFIERVEPEVFGEREDPAKASK